MIGSPELRFLTEHLPFASRLQKEDLNLIAAVGSKSVFSPGDMIMNGERECNGVVFVQSGQLRAYFESEDGKEITLYRLLPGDICILTASCILKNITFEVTLEVEKDSEVLFVPASAWSELSERHAAVRAFSMELVNERFSEVMWVMEQLVSKNMGQRIAAFLLEQAALEHSSTLSITHETIAKNLGTAREVISRILKYLENDGLLKLSRGRIVLSEPKKLRAISESLMH